MSQGEHQPTHTRPAVDDDPARPLEVGRAVCVRDRFLGNWSSGFEVIAVFSDGYHLRRVSDDLAFPDVFPFDDVRVERRYELDRGVAGSYLDRRR